MRTRARATATTPPPAACAAGHASYALTGAIRRGDERAFAQFYELWFDRLFTIARACTRRDEAFCLDVVQDCFVRVVDRMPGLADDAAVQAWLTRTLLRLAVDRLRADARRTVREQAVAVDRPEELAPPADSLIDAEQRTWLAHQLAELPAADAALLHARFVHGATAAAAGADLHLNADAAAGRIRRLLLRLQRAAKEFFDV